MAMTENMEANHTGLSKNRVNALALGGCFHPISLTINLSNSHNPVIRDTYLQQLHDPALLCTQINICVACGFNNVW